MPDRTGASSPPTAMKSAPPKPVRRNRPPDPDETQHYAEAPESLQDPEVFTEPEPRLDPEVPAGMEELATWDEPPAAAGVRIKPIPPEDENQTVDLVSEGIEEADRELRLEAQTETEEEPADTEDDDYPRGGILS